MPDKRSDSLVLLADIGNTDTVFAIARGKRIAHSWRIGSRRLPSRNDVWQSVARELRRLKIDPAMIGGSAISSVIPVLTATYASSFRRHLHEAPLVIHAGLESGLQIRYRPRTQLGPDRLCAAVAAYALYGGPVIAVDCGTATTFEAVTAEGVYLGGAIAPGLKTAAASLSHSTARLPMIELKFPRNVIGTDTLSAMRAGILYGAVDAINGLAERMSALTGSKTTLVLTGGLSTLLKKHITRVTAVEPNLVLLGALFMFLRATGTKRRYA